MSHKQLALYIRADFDVRVTGAKVTITFEDPILASAIQRTAEALCIRPVDTFGEDLCQGGLTGMIRDSVLPWLPSGEVIVPEGWFDDGFDDEDERPQ